HPSVRGCPNRPLLPSRSRACDGQQAGRSARDGEVDGARHRHRRRQCRGARVPRKGSGPGGRPSQGSPARPACGEPACWPRRTLVSGAIDRAAKRLLRLRVFSLLLLCVLTYGLATITTMYRAPNPLFALAALVGVVVMMLDLVLLARRIADATPS